MKEFLMVAAGGALGSVARWLLAMAVDARLAACWPGFPWGTLLVNVVGCLVIGVVAVWSDQSWVKHFVMFGILGGFTTFSSFALQTSALAGNAAHAQFATYVVGSVLACLVAVWLGQLLGRLLVG